MSRTLTPHYNYYPGVDGLRAVSILLVLILHANLISEWGLHLVSGGFLGVDMFFVISGFLITSLLLKEHGLTGSIELRRFYARRALRLLPALITCLLFTAALASIVGADRLGLTPWRTLSIFGYFTNWVRASESWDLWFLSHFWSLAIEEQFYLCWPLILICLLRFCGKRSVIAVVLALTVACFCWRLTLYLGGAPNQRLYHGTDTRGDALLVGCLAALGSQWRVLPSFISSKYLAQLSAIALGAMVMVLNEGSAFLYLGGFTLVALCSAVLILWAISNQPILDNSVMVWVGKRAYGLYVWHWPIYQLALVLPKPVVVPAALAATLGAAYISYRYVEEPFLRLKKSNYQAKAAPSFS